MNTPEALLYDLQGMCFVHFTGQMPNVNHQITQRMLVTAGNSESVGTGDAAHNSTNSWSFGLIRVALESPHRVEYTFRLLPRNSEVT